MKPAPGEGIYYVVRFPAGWKAVFYRFEDDSDYNHYEWWEQSISAMIAAKWAKALGKSREAIRRDIELLTYAFPRGRISKVGKRFLVLHGADLTPSMRMSKKLIEDAFGISGRCSWRFDEHEQCQVDDKEAIRQYFGIHEYWNGV